jgi:hypothetical protein
MCKRVLFALLMIAFAGGSLSAAAQSASRAKPATEVTPSWTYKGRWTGFITCNRLQLEGNTVTPDQVKKCISEGGTYVLHTGNRIDLRPAAKLDAYAGQQAIVYGTMTSARYGTGPSSDPAVEGLYSGGDRPATKFQAIDVTSVQVMPPLPPRKAEGLHSRIHESAFK